MGGVEALVVDVLEMLGSCFVQQLSKLGASRQALADKIADLLLR